MADYSELMRLAEAATNASWLEDILGDVLEIAPIDGEDQAFILAASPAAVFELIAELEQAQAERDALASLLRKFVEGESNEGESHAYRHSYVSDAEVLLARLGGEFKDYSIVPDEALENQSAECRRLRAEVGGLRKASARWAKMDPSFVIEHIRETSRFDADLIEAMLEFAIGAALAKEAQHG